MVNKYDNYELRKVNSLKNAPGTIKDGDGYIWDPSELPDKDFDDSKVPLNYRRLAIWMRSKLFGKEVRETIARLAEMFGLNFKELMESFESLDNRQDAVETYTSQSVAQIAQSVAQSVAQMEADKNAVIANVTVDSEVILARGGKTTLGARLDETTAQLAQKADFEEVVLKGKNLINNSDFNNLPNIKSRSSVYQFNSGITSPQHKNNKALKIEAISYESSPDTNKDFVFMLNEIVKSNEVLNISFWVYPTVTNKSILMRMAYSGGTFVNLGEANKWNKITLSLNTSDMTQNNSYLYVDLRSSFTMYMSELQIEVKREVKQDISTSFMQVNNKLEQNPLTIQNSNGIVERLIEVGNSYLNHASEFSYSSFTTAWDTVTEKVNGKHVLDCSSFASLLIHGVTFENSRYSGNAENKGSKLFFQGIDSYKYRYANQMARFAFDNGYAFKPNEDFSNVQAGDILFFSWKDGINGDLSAGDRQHSFMKIDHVGMFLHRKNEGFWSLLQYDVGASSVFYDVTNGYMEQCVLAARFPFENVESSTQNENLIVDGDVVKTQSSGTGVGSYKLLKPLEKGKTYTILMKGQVNTANCYFTIMTKTYATIYSDQGRQLPYSDLIEFKFTYGLDEITDSIYIGIGARGGTTTSRSATVNSIALHEGYLKNKRNIEKSSVISTIKDFPLVSNLVPDLNAGYSVYRKYAVDGNKIFINLHLPFNTNRTGELLLGNIGETFTATQKIPLELKDATNKPIYAVLQVGTNGDVKIIPWDVTTQWNHAVVNGCIFRS